MVVLTQGLNSCNELFKTKVVWSLLQCGPHRNYSGEVRPVFAQVFVASNVTAVAQTSTGLYQEPQSPFREAVIVC